MNGVRRDLSPANLALRLGLASCPDCQWRYGESQNGRKKARQRAESFSYFFLETGTNRRSTTAFH